MDTARIWRSTAAFAASAALMAIGILPAFADGGAQPAAPAPHAQPASEPGTPAGEGSAADEPQDPPLTTPITDNNGHSWNTLYEALKNAPENAVLTLPAGTIPLAKPVTIGANNVTVRVPNNTIIRRDAEGKEHSTIWVANATSLTIETTGSGSLSIRGGFFDGASLFGVDSYGKLTLRGNIDIRGVEASGVDGSIVNNAGVFYAEGVKFRQSIGRNGVIYNTGNADIKFCTFLQDTARGSGGAIVNGGTMKVTGGSFDTTNAEGGLGGAIWAEGNSFTHVTGVTFGISVRDQSASGITAIAAGDANSRIKLGNSNVFKNKREILLLSPSLIEIDGQINADKQIYVTLSDPGAGQPVFQFPTKEAAQNSFPNIHVEGGFVAIDEDNPTIIATVKAKDSVVLDTLKNPYKDELGLDPKDSLLTPELREKFVKDVDEFYTKAHAKEVEKNRAVARARTIASNVAHLLENKAAVASTVMTLSQLGPWDANMNRGWQSLSFDNRDLTGLYIERPKTTSPTQAGLPNADKTVVLNVFVEGPKDSQPVVFVYRQIGVTESRDYGNVKNRTIQLHNGYNRVAINVWQKKPLAVYIRNNSTEPAKVRIEAEDSGASASNAEAPATQPNSAAPVILGTQLHTYPVYISDPKHPERLWDFLEYLRQWWTDTQAAKSDAASMGPNMVDFRFGRQDISTSAQLAVAAYSDVNTPQKAAAADEKANKELENRIATFEKFDGFDPSAPAGNPNAIFKLRRVTLFDDAITFPSYFYAHFDHYHLLGGNLKSFIRGNIQGIFDWANSHEYGHMLDNRYFTRPEMTNNMYSIWGGIQRFKDNLDKDASFNAMKPSIGSAFHGALQGAGDSVDRFMNARIVNPQLDIYTAPNNWKNGGWFYHTLTLYSSMRFFDNWDYATKYPYSEYGSVFTPERAAEVKKYGAFGTALRMIRTDHAWLEKLVPTQYKNDHENDVMMYNRMVAMATYATGYNICQFYEKRGFTLLTEPVADYCKTFPDLPVKLQYFHLRQDLMEVENQIRHNRPLFDTTTEASVASISKNKKGQTVLTLAVNNHQNALALFEVYRDGKLVGFTRTAKFTDTTAPADVTKDRYTTIAYDYRLRPSNLQYVTISFAGEGTGLPDGAVIERGSTYTIPQDTPTLDHGDFLGWKIDDGDTLYQPGDVIPASKLTADVTLTAQWSKWSIPTDAPTEDPTDKPTWTPTISPTAIPTDYPTVDPLPTWTPTISPTAIPTDYPTVDPLPTWTPTISPTAIPTDYPTVDPLPTWTPTISPTAIPTDYPTVDPLPTWEPTMPPTYIPSVAPVVDNPPTWWPSDQPTNDNHNATITAGKSKHLPATGVGSMPILFVATLLAVVGGALIRRSTY